MEMMSVYVATAMMSVYVATETKDFMLSWRLYLYVAMAIISLKLSLKISVYALIEMNS